MDNSRPQVTVPDSPEKEAVHKAWVQSLLSNANSHESFKVEMATRVAWAKTGVLEAVRAGDRDKALRLTAEADVCTALGQLLDDCAFAIKQRLDYEAATR